MSALAVSEFHDSDPYRTYVFESAAAESYAMAGVDVMFIGPVLTFFPGGTVTPGTVGESAAQLVHPVGC